MGKYTAINKFKHTFPSLSKALALPKVYVKNITEFLKRLPQWLLHLQILFLKRGR